MAFKEDPTRTRRQLESLRKFKLVGFRGTLEAATGFGKTQVAIMLVLKALQKLSVPPSIMIVVDGDYLRSQWENRLEEAGICGVNIQIINSAIKRRWECDLLILDEIHGYVAEQFGKIFKKVRYRWILGLTATIDTDDPKYSIVAEKCPIFDVISLKECRENNWVSDFTVYNLGLNLDPEDWESYYRASALFNANFAFFGHDFKLMMSCLSNIKAAKNHAYELYRNPSRYGEVMGIARKANSGMQKRKALLYNADVKVRAVVELVGRFPNRKMILFSQTTEMAERIKDHLNDRYGNICVSYHSDIKGEERQDTKTLRTKKIGAKKVREERINLFTSENTGIRILSTAKALDQGADIEGVDMGCITSGNSTKRQAIQRIGRIIRYKENKEALIVNLYIVNSQDRKWLSSRQKDIPRKYIQWITKVEDIV